jgi:outer membrane protein TolC
VLLALLAGLPRPGAAPAQLPNPAASPPPAHLLWDSTFSPTGADDAAAFFSRGPVPIDFPAALRLAQTSNLDIAQAREAVAQAQALVLRAQAQILPNFALGSTYTKHEGNIAKTEGNIIKANKDSLFVGGGPSLSVALNDALFLPLVARQTRAAAQAGVQRVTLDTLLAVADAYLGILRARRRLARIDETLDYLTSDQRTPNRADAKGLYPLVKDFVESGQVVALRADLARVEVEIARRQDERRAALQDLRLATAELARLLHLDPQVPLWPVENFRTALSLPGEAWLNQTVEELVGFALRNRPELAESEAVVQAAIGRLRAAKTRPLVPTLVSNFSWGDFGGGPDLNDPIIRPPTTKGGAPTTVTVSGFGPSGRIRHFAPRTDYDVSLVWKLQNLGLGNLAEVREQKALVQQAELRRLAAQDRVATQVVQAQELLESWKDRLAIARAALFDDKGKANGPVFLSLRLNFARIRNVEGTRPLEVLDSIRGLSDVLEAYGQALTDYERSHFRLLVVLGLPPEGLLDPACLPPPPAAATPSP